jgi:O-antigen ligase
VRDPQVRIRWYDVIGLLLAAGLSAWTAISASVSGGRSQPQLALLVAALAAYVAGRQLSHRAQLAAGIVAAGLLAVAVITIPETFVGPPRHTPLNYENADAAWFAQGTAAAVMLAVSARTRRVRALAWLGAAVLVAVAAGLRSVAGAGLATVVVLVGAAAHRARPRPTATIGMVAVLAAVAATVFLASLPGSAVARVAERGLSERRIVLWQEALELTEEHPVFGVGPAQFAVEAPTARQDPDARWAHSAYLQEAAESGIPGTVLLSGLLGWAYGALGRSGRDSAIVVVAIAGLTALAVHAAIDYVLHFPAIVLTSAFLLGVATGRPTPPRSPP